MAELGMEELRAQAAKDTAKARQRSIIVSQLNVARAGANTELKLRTYVPSSSSFLIKPSNQTILPICLQFRK